MTDQQEVTQDGTRSAESGRERVLRAAYDLFSRGGVRAVGVDTVIAEAGVAKMTLYRNYPSKNDLILDFLRLRETLWTHEWLESEAKRRGSTPEQQLLAVFDVFTEWFAKPDFEGCSFLTTMIEVNDPEHPVHRASVEHLATIRKFVAELAAGAGVEDADSFARQWHILMKGSIMAAHEGDLMAAKRAKELGLLLLRSHGIVTPKT